MNTSGLNLVLASTEAQRLALSRFIAGRTYITTVHVGVDRSLPDGYLSVTLENNGHYYSGGIAPDGATST
jgi:hypothetical protein